MTALTKAILRWCSLMLAIIWAILLTTIVFSTVKSAILLAKQRIKHLPKEPRVIEGEYTHR